MDNYNNRPQSKRNTYHQVAKVAMMLALFVIMLGSYTRLTDAGLGCPDWPGCYGEMVLPHSQAELKQAQQLFPQQPIVASKAWTEMAHRYVAGLLGILILGLALVALVKRQRIVSQPLWVPWLLVALVIFQSLLGMWTVTLKVLPLVVTAHLLGGVTIAALLCWLMHATKQQSISGNYRLNILRPWVLIGLVIIVLQIFLGAWTSTNYAALACPDFPYCQGALFPHMNWLQAFHFFSPIGPNYEGGRLGMDARATIHMAHRFGAFVTAMYLLPFSLCLLLVREFTSLRRLGGLLLVLLIAQLCLGVLNIVTLLPVPIAVAHNGVAALLLLTMVTILYRLYVVDRQRWM